MLKRLRGDVRGELVYGEEPGPEGPKRLASEMREAADARSISSSSAPAPLGCEGLPLILFGTIRLGSGEDDGLRLGLGSGDGDS